MNRIGGNHVDDYRVVVDELVGRCVLYLWIPIEACFWNRIIFIYLNAYYFASRILLELDYMKEARNAERFRRLYCGDLRTPFESGEDSTAAMDTSEQQEPQDKSDWAWGDEWKNTIANARCPEDYIVAPRIIWELSGRLVDG